MHGRETLTALYSDEVAAERAMERLRALGVPEESMELHPASEGDVLPGEQPTGLFALGSLLSGGSVGDGPGRSGVVLVATGVPGEIVNDARSVLQSEATEVEATPETSTAQADERWDG